MGWVINIDLEGQINEEEIDKIITELPPYMRLDASIKQPWGWSLLVDIRLKRPSTLQLSGSYSISGMIAPLFAECLSYRLKEHGYKNKIEFRDWG